MTLFLCQFKISKTHKGILNHTCNFEQFIKYHKDNFMRLHNWFTSDLPAFWIFDSSIEYRVQSDPNTSYNHQMSHEGYYTWNGWRRPMHIWTRRRCPSDTLCILHWRSISSSSTSFSLLTGSIPSTAIKSDKMLVVFYAWLSFGFQQGKEPRLQRYACMQHDQFEAWIVIYKIKILIFTPKFMVSEIKNFR